MMKVIVAGLMLSFSQLNNAESYIKFRPKKKLSNNSWIKFDDLSDTKNKLYRPWISVNLQQAHISL